MVVSLRQLHDGKERVPHAVRGLEGVCDACVEYAVDLQCDIVGRDGHLVRNRQGLLLERVHVGDAVHDRDQQVEPRLQHTLKFSETLDNLHRVTV
jgi:hypothetical protein